MLIKTKFLKDYIPDLNYAIDELAEKLTLAGHEATKLNQDTLEVEIKPNRGDCLSVYGLARDLAGLYSFKLNQPSTSELPPITKIINLEVQPSAKSLVLNDSLLGIDNYRPQASPVEIIEKLKCLNLQPKDLLVDLTNVIAYELGVPLHAFDQSLLPDGLTIECLTQPQSVTLINGQEVGLMEGTLIQRSGQLVVDLAGIMGTNRASIKPSSSQILIQAAVFEPSRVRHNSQLSRVSSQASYQYQRGVDPEACNIALGRLIYLLKQAQPSIVLTGYQQYKIPRYSQSIEFDLANIVRLLGHPVGTNDLANLAKLGFEINNNQLTVPSWRQDINQVADVAEEVMRLIGLGNIQATQLDKADPKPGLFEQLYQLRLELVNLGLTETISSSFVANDGDIAIKNPRSSLDKFLRPNLKESLLRVLAGNPFNKQAQIFEIGAIFNQTEQNALAIILAGQDNILEAIKAKLAKYNCQVSFEAVDQSTLEHFEVSQRPVWFAQIYLNQLVLPKPKPITEVSALPVVKPLSKFPPVVRDVTLLVDRSVDTGLLANGFRAINDLILCELVDSYQSAKLGENKVALTFRFYFQNQKRSLIDSEVTETLNDYFQKLSGQLQFQIR